MRVQGSNLLCFKFLATFSVRVVVRLESFGRVGVDGFGCMIAIPCTSSFSENSRCVSRLGVGVEVWTFWEG